MAGLRRRGWLRAWWRNEYRLRGFLSIFVWFHVLADVLLVACGVLIVRVVSCPGWRHHLRWAIPAAAASTLVGLGRLARDLHHYFGIGAPLRTYLAADAFNYLGNLVSLYATFMLWRTLRDLARDPSSPDRLALPPPQPGVWPPPPTVGRE